MTKRKLPVQLDLGLDEPVRLPSKHPELVLRWKNDGVEAFWPEFNLVSWMRDWPTALDLALHNNNMHVSVRVRV